MVGTRPLQNEEQNERNVKFCYCMTENIYFHVIGWEQAKSLKITFTFARQLNLYRRVGNFLSVIMNV